MRSSRIILEKSLGSMSVEGVDDEDKQDEEAERSMRTAFASKSHPGQGLVPRVQVVQGALLHIVTCAECGRLHAADDKRKQKREEQTA